MRTTVTRSNRTTIHQLHRPLIQSIRAEESPAIRLTICPRVAFISTDEMTALLDDANRMFLHSIFGTKWKRMKSPLTILCPETESRRTTANQPQLLHYHGCVWTSNPRVLFRYRAGGFGSFVRELVFRRFEPQSFPSVLVQDFDPTMSWTTYSTKNYGRDFNDGDTYVFGHNRKNRRGNSARAI